MSAAERAGLSTAIWLIHHLIASMGAGAFAEDDSARRGLLRCPLLGRIGYGSSSRERCVGRPRSSAQIQVRGEVGRPHPERNSGAVPLPHTS